MLAVVLLCAGRLHRHLAMDDLPHRGPAGIQPAGPLQGPLAVRREHPGAGGDAGADRRRRPPAQVGILEAMPGPGRHFYSPLEYETQLVKDQVIPPGKIGVLVSKIGKPLPEGTYLVDDKGYRGILRKVLTPGRYRINTYAYDVKVVDVDACAEPNTRVKRKADDPTLIPPGYVGVVTNKASDPLTGEDAASRSRSCSPGSTSSIPRRSGSTSSASAIPRPA